MIVVSNHHALPAAEADTLVEVMRRDEPGIRTPSRVASIATVDNGAGRPFTPLQPALAPDTALDVRPAVVGRALTPLERRLEHSRIHAADIPNHDVAAVIETLRAAAAQHRGDTGISPRIAVPPPMPTHLDLDQLLHDNPGDGVPLGVADDPSRADVRTLWWAPGSGSLLLYGSRRSGVEQVLTTVLLGLTDRFADDDVQLVVVEPSSTTRRAVQQLGRDAIVVAPDQVDEVNAAFDTIAEYIDSRPRSTAAPGRPRPVMLISDLVQLRRLHADRDLGNRIDEVLGMAAADDSGVDVIAYASDLGGAGPFAPATTNRLVGASSNRDELAMLGSDQAGELDGIAGRCLAMPGGDLVQLAVSDAAAEKLLQRRGGDQ